MAKIAPLVWAPVVNTARSSVPNRVPRPVNTVVLLREAYVMLNELAVERLAERGHDTVRSAHGAVFQYLDEDGTTVSTLATGPRSPSRRWPSWCSIWNATAMSPEAPIRRIGGRSWFNRRERGTR